MKILIKKLCYFILRDYLFNMVVWLFPTILKNLLTLSLFVFFFKKQKIPFHFLLKFKFAKFSLSSMKLKIWKFRLYSYGFILFLSMLWPEIIISGSYFLLLEFCSWIIDKGLYFRRWFKYCCFGIWMKIINYWLSFEFFLFTYSGVFNKTQFMDM